MMCAGPFHPGRLRPGGGGSCREAGPRHAGAVDQGGSANAANTRQVPLPLQHARAVKGAVVSSL